MPRQLSSLTLADARALIAAGEKKASELGIPYNIAVVDAGGGLIAHVRMDGAWLGANRGNTYLSFSIDPGEHHFCVDWSSSGFERGLVSLTNLTAEPGKIYYLRARTTGGRYTFPSLDLELVNSDEGKLLLALSAPSHSEIKKRGPK